MRRVLALHRANLDLIPWQLIWSPEPSKSKEHRVSLEHCLLWPQTTTAATTTATSSSTTAAATAAKGKDYFPAFCTKDVDRLSANSRDHGGLENVTLGTLGEEPGLLFHDLAGPSGVIQLWTWQTLAFRVPRSRGKLEKRWQMCSWRDFKWPVWAVPRKPDLKLQDVLRLPWDFSEKSVPK